MDREETLPSPLHNWISLAGIPLALFGFVVGATLILVDLGSSFASPYLGIFTYLVVPVILVAGLALIGIGVLRERRRRRFARSDQKPLPVIDLNDRRHFTAFVASLLVLLLFLALSGVGAYRAYHFTESVTFCGVTCHEVMEPEHTAYLDSPHASVLCAACHIGSDADWFVKSKLSGVRQVFATLANSYHRPIDTPLANLRPAEQAVTEVQGIYARSFFPRMRVDWRVYPDHIGHMISPGCFRCHDGQHVTGDGKRITRECDACHTILAQGPSIDRGQLSASGLAFQHPDEDIGDAWQEMRCDECHTGAPYR